MTGAVRGREQRGSAVGGVFGIALVTMVLVALGWAAAGHAATLPVTEATSMSSLTAVACAGSSTCYAVGTDSDENPALLTVTNGSPGAVTDFPDDGFEPLGIACPSAGSCLAVGQELDANSGQEVGAFVPVSGGTPGATQEVSSTLSLYNVACSGAAYCIATAQDNSTDVGTVEISGGSPGSFAAIPGSNFGSEGVGCESSDKCIVVGANGFPPSASGAFSVITDGSPGALQDGGSATDLSDVDCWSTTSCAAVGNTGDGTDANGDPITAPLITDIVNGQPGASWTYTGQAGGTMGAISCPTAAGCLAIGADANGNPFAAPVDGGKAGAASALTPSASVGDVQLTALACSSAGSCVAVGQDESANPIVADVPVPAFQALSPTTPGSTGTPPAKTVGKGKGKGKGKAAPKKGRKRKQAYTRLLIGVSWSAVPPVRSLEIAVRCQNATDLGGIEGARVRLQDRSQGSHGRWRTVAAATTRRVGRVHGEARFRVAAHDGERMEFRAAFAATSRYRASTSSTKTIVIGG